MMKKAQYRKKLLAAITAVLLTISMGTSSTFAYMGSMGYEGGISAADPFEDGTYSYREVSFITGKPTVFEGTMTVKKSSRQGKISSTYTYSLQNTEQNATLTRVIVMDTLTEIKENGQTVESSKLTRIPTEIIRVGGTTYSLTDYRFTRSGITDPQPAVYYNAGEFTIQKKYRVGTGGTVSIEMSGNQYGYDQYWSSAKAGTVNINIQADLGTTDNASWGGYARVSVSNTAKKGFQYVENVPWQISFEGGYVEKNWEESILEYDATLPEFDQSGKATEVLKRYTQQLGLDSEPISTRLMVPDLKHLKGHWAEESVKILFSLEVLPGTGENFNPTKYVNRREFTAMVVRAVKDIPADPDLIVRTTSTTSSRNKTPEISPFADVALDDPFYQEIKTASTRGIIQGTGQAHFSPDRYITFAEAVTILIRALGLENLASYPNAVTPFTDNDVIPTYARNSAAVAYRIGLVQGDNRGYFHPNTNLTYERASAIVYRLIQYMGEDLEKDYRDHLLDY